MTDPLLAVRDLSVRFPVRAQRTLRSVLAERGKPVLRQWVHAVDDVSFEVAPGTTVGLVGESGSGKSTIGNAILGLVPIHEGSITMGGIEVADASAADLKRLRRRAAMVFQDPLASLDPRRTILDSVSDPLEIHGLHKANRKQRVSELLEMVGLSDRFLMRYPHQLSGGQRQRVCIARALAVEPELIVLDEATASLDVSVQAQVMNLLKRLQRELQLSYLFISHDLAAVEYMSHEVVVLYLGRTMETAGSSELYADAAHPYTQALLSAVPAADPIAERSRERIVLTGEVPSPLNPPSGCVFRTRCPRAIDACAEAIPPMIDVADGHRAACIRIEAARTRG